MVIYPYLKIEQAPVTIVDEVEVVDEFVTSKMMLSDDINKYVSKVILVERINNEIIESEIEFPITLTDRQLEIKSMDDNVYVENIYDGDDLTEINLYSIREGTAEIWAYYDSEDSVEKIVGFNEIVVHKTWFKDNYKTFISTYDAVEIGEDTYADILFKSCMETYDILWAYTQDIKEIKDPLFAKNKFVNAIGKSMGFAKIDFNVDRTPGEFAAQKLYRDLLFNLQDLLYSRGTKLSYEMFFGALGFDIELLEFWYDENNNLIEINSSDDTFSSFNVYSEEGNLLNENMGSTDPRGKVDANNPWNYCNKSPYLKPVLTPKVGYEDTVEYTVTNRQIIEKYLEFLRPEWIKYLKETVGISFTEEEDTLWSLEDSDADDINVARLLMPMATWDGDNWITDYKPIKSFYNIDTSEMEEISLGYNYSVEYEKFNTNFDTADGGADWIDPTNLLNSSGPETYTTVTISRGGSLVPVASSSIVLSDIDVSEVPDLDIDGIGDNIIAKPLTKPNEITFNILAKIDADIELGSSTIKVRYIIDGTEGEWNIFELTFAEQVLSFKTGVLDKIISWESTIELEIVGINDNFDPASVVIISVGYVNIIVDYYESNAFGDLITSDPGYFVTNDLPGTWHDSGGGMAVDEIFFGRNQFPFEDTEKFLVYTNIKMIEIASFPIQYDTKNVRNYGDDGLLYDAPIMLLDIPKPDKTNEIDELEAELAALIIERDDPETINPSLVQEEIDLQEQLILDTHADFDLRETGILIINLGILRLEYLNLVSESGSENAKSIILSNGKYIGLSENKFDEIIAN